MQAVANASVIHTCNPQNVLRPFNQWTANWMSHLLKRHSGRFDGATK